MAWEPNPEVVTYLEKFWKGCVDELPLANRDGTVGELVDILAKDGFPDAADHLRSKYSHSLEQRVQVPTTLGEFIDGVKKGTPYGVLMYVNTAIHRGCCLKDDN